MIDFDNLVKTYNKKGIATPKKEMIKTKEQIEGIKKAGIINTMVLDYVSENIHVGMTTEDINTLKARLDKQDEQLAEYKKLVDRLLKEKELQDSSKEILI